VITGWGGGFFVRYHVIFGSPLGPGGGATPRRHFFNNSQFRTSIFLFLWDGNAKKDSRKKPRTGAWSRSLPLEYRFHKGDYHVITRGWGGGSFGRIT
jgi:hypothetical protein